MSTEKCMRTGMDILSLAHIWPSVFVSLCVIFSDFLSFAYLSSHPPPIYLSLLVNKILNLPLCSLNPLQLSPKKSSGPEKEHPDHPQPVSFELLFPIFMSFPIVKPFQRPNFRSLTLKIENFAPPGRGQRWLGAQPEVCFLGWRTLAETQTADVTQSKWRKPLPNHRKLMPMTHFSVTPLLQKSIFLDRRQMSKSRKCLALWTTRRVEHETGCSIHWQMNKTPDTRLRDGSHKVESALCYLTSDLWQIIWFSSVSFISYE